MGEGAAFPVEVHNTAKAKSVHSLMEGANAVA